MPGLALDGARTRPKPAIRAGEGLRPPFRSQRMSKEGVLAGRPKRSRARSFRNVTVTQTKPVSPLGRQAKALFQEFVLGMILYSTRR